MSENRSGSFIVGLLLGAAAGTITGILVAPRPGKETRKLLKKSADALPELAEDLSTTVQIQADRLSESALRNWDETLLRLKEAIAAGIEASQRERQILKRTDAAASEEELYSHSYASGAAATADDELIETMSEPQR
ncbi:MAG TPA: gas vesicle protein [Cyanobacteria bacterium UBA11371]|nr:gas vesicle protein [Cyanobacteria bacterium UBA11371]HBE32912.1 gas vesicle protein [Cyanobacteria bacterium UBA11368]